MEEEFIISDRANIYGYAQDGPVEVEQADVPYATRILVRRPQNPQRFSGNVYLETSHPQHGADFV